MAERAPSNEPADGSEVDDDGNPVQPLSVSDLGSEMNRRHLLTVLGSAGTLATAGCLGLLGDRSETGPRPGDPTPAEGSGGAATTTTAGDVETFDIEWLNEGATIGVDSDDSLLSTALDEDLDPPYQCERGICGVCTSKVDGDATEYVEHGLGQYENEYLSDEQVEAGYFLTCVGYPKQDFALETGMQEEADSYTGGEGGEETTDAAETTEAETRAPDAEVYDIEWLNEGATVGVAESEMLLDRALDEGLEPPWQCGHGVCGVCTSKVDGDGTEYVEHDGNQYLSDEQVEAGYVLTCVGSPKQDFTLETGVQDEADEV